MRQADRDAQHAANARKDGDFEWSCFAAQQAAEKALKSALQKRNKEGWGHSVMGLCLAFGQEMTLPPGMLDASKRLDKHYIPARNPNGFPSGAPLDYYTKEDADIAVNDANQIIRFCKSL
jgi:HEPN domain-containing protein